MAVLQRELTTPVLPYARRVNLSVQSVPTTGWMYAIGYVGDIEVSITKKCRYFSADQRTMERSVINLLRREIHEAERKDKETSRRAGNQLQGDEEVRS